MRNCPGRQALFVLSLELKTAVVSLSGVDLAPGEAYHWSKKRVLNAKEGWLLKEA